MDSSSSDEHDDPARSSLRLDITLSIGYQRRRAQVGARWEGGVVTIMLLVAGSAVTLYWLYALYSLFAARQGG